jgi:tetratricopeptide (TPR) repeat protein
MPDQADEDDYQRGLELQRQDRHAEAIEVLLPLSQRVLTSRLAMNLGVSFSQLGDREQALHYLQLAVRHRPDLPDARRMLGNAYAELGETAAAEAEYRAALAADPANAEAELALGALYLSMGRCAEGWPLLQARTTLFPGAVPPASLSFPEWQGEPLAGRSLLVLPEQGFGDQIQMARFAKTLKASGAARVSLACRAPLAPLFSTVEAADRIIAVGAGEVVEVGPHDYWTRYFSLPAHLGVTLETLPAAPYLAAPADRRARWAGFAAGARVGLVSRAGPHGFNAANKTLPADLARRLLDAGLISLEPEDTGAGDFADTAAIVETLDLVVSIDTAAAHLAGAMGKPCWTLLPHVACDWRWLRGRTDSPWYPGMTLYRHDARQDWPAMVERVLADLAAAGLTSEG